MGTFVVTEESWPMKFQEMLVYLHINRWVIYYRWQQTRLKVRIQIVTISNWLPPGCIKAFTYSSREIPVLRSTHWHTNLFEQTMFSFMIYIVEIGMQLIEVLEKVCYSIVDHYFPGTNASNVPKIHLRCWTLNWITISNYLLWLVPYRPLNTMYLFLRRVNIMLYSSAHSSETLNNFFSGHV